MENYIYNIKEKVLLMWRNCNPCVLLVAMQNGAVTMENHVAVSQKIKNKITIYPEIPLLSIYPK